MPAPTLVYYPTVETPLTPDEIAAEFSRLGKKDPLARALRQLLQERLAHATIDAAAGDKDSAGRLQEILSLQQQFSTLLDQGAALRKSGASTRAK
jgi:hypothetical protein